VQLLRSGAGWGYVAAFCLRTAAQRFRAAAAIALRPAALERRFSGCAPQKARSSQVGRSGDVRQRAILSVHAALNALLRRRTLPPHRSLGHLGSGSLRASRSALAHCHGCREPRSPETASAVSGAQGQTTTGRRLHPVGIGNAEPIVPVTRCAGECEAGHPDPLPSRGFRFFRRWKSNPTGRPDWPKDLRQLIREIASENVPWGGEMPAMGRAQASARSAAAMADLRPQPCHGDCRVRLLRRGHGHLPHPLRVRDHRRGNATNSPSQRDRSSERGVDAAAVPGGTARRPFVSIPDPRPG
jgi:hypothetical protein